MGRLTDIPAIEGQAPVAGDCLGILATADQEMEEAVLVVGTRRGIPVQDVVARQVARIA